MATSLALVYVSFSTYTSSESSIRLPVAVVSLWSNLAASELSIFLLSDTYYDNYLRVSSNYLYSLVKTLDNNYYSRPVYVTVKSIIKVLADNSGEKSGFGILVKRNISKSSWTSNWDS